MFIRTRSLSAIALAALIAFPSLASAATLQPLERWRSYAGVSWDTPQNGQTPTRFSGSVNAPIAGIHFDAKGRAFVSTPRLVSAAAPATLPVLATLNLGSMPTACRRSTNVSRSGLPVIAACREA